MAVSNRYFHLQSPLILIPSMFLYTVETQRAGIYLFWDNIIVESTTTENNRFPDISHTIKGPPRIISDSPTTLSDYPDTTNGPLGTINGSPRTISGSNRTKLETNAAKGLPAFCCKDCSCQRNCRLASKSCCFPELTHTFVDDSIETCTYAQWPVPQVEKHFDVNAYYMVDRNAHGGSLDKDISAQYPEMDCGDIEAADWGSLYPVSSVSTGKIYRNVHCAKCHGVHDAKFWQASIENCENKNVLMFPILTEQLMLGYCHINFESTQEAFNIDERRCFSGKIINYCSSFNFFVPDTLGMSASMVVTACHDSIFSPYSHEHLYANVFCLMCNNDLRNLDNQKDNCTKNINGRTTPFTAILVPWTRTFYPGRRQNQVCMEPQYHPIGNSCRSLFCQSGKTLVDVRCQFTTEIVYNADFVVNIVILHAFNISLIKNETVILLLLSYIDRAWGDNWIILNVAISRNLSPRKEIFVVTLKYYSNGRGVFMYKLLEGIKNNLHHFANSPFPSLNEDAFVHLKQSNRLGHVICAPTHLNQLLEKDDTLFVGTNVNKEKLMTSVQTYETVYTYVVKSNATTISLSELFYCKQVQLYQQEFHLINNEVVYIKHLDLLLYGGQFITVPGQDGHGPKIRICLQDSGFSLDISSSSDRIVIATSKILGILVAYAVVMCLLSIS